jgi:putative Holliday junction resolvase
MKRLGLDLGNRTLGVAISDAAGFLARPWTTLRFAELDFPTAVKDLLQLIESEPIERIVLGMPRRMDGTIGTQGEHTLRFVELLQEATDIPIELVDERLTSKLAQHLMQDQNLSRGTRRKKKDEMAAVLILQGHLDQAR